MRILLDECLPRKLKQDLIGHHVLTVPDMGWRGVKNGELLRRAENSFDVFITIDQGLQYQQNLEKAKIAIVVLAAQDNQIESLHPLMTDVLIALNSIRRGELVYVGS